MIFKRLKMTASLTLFILWMFCQTPPRIFADEPVYHADEPIYHYVGQEDILDVWSGNPVGFAFLAHKGAVYIGCYGADQSMTIGRKEPSGEWEFKTLPTKTGWDSHNYVDMAFDADDILHVSGNMHGVPLIYFRASKPNDIASLERMEKMTGQLEKKVTYPRFIIRNDGRLLFTYRDGRSGNGSQYWNIYDEKTKSWSRFFDSAFFDGEGERNAYFCGPKWGRDGWYHLCWVWRDSPLCETNHDLFYARSKDLAHWETSGGEPVSTPIRFGDGELIDPVPAGGGILNSRIFIGFDSDGRVILSYSKYDADRNYQIWNTRRNAQGWQPVQVSDWDYQWDFQGGGSLPSVIQFSGVSVDERGGLVQTWSHIPEKKSGSWRLDPVSLKPVADHPGPKRKEGPKLDPAAAALLTEIRHSDPRMRAQRKETAFGDDYYVFRWETLPVNRDRPQEGGAPLPSTLRVLKFSK